jgi:hypothetical protein
MLQGRRREVCLGVLPLGNAARRALLLVNIPGSDIGTDVEYIGAFTGFVHLA